MKLPPKFFLAGLILTMASASWAACNDLICGEWLKKDDAIGPSKRLWSIEIVPYAGSGSWQYQEVITFANVGQKVGDVMGLYKSNGDGTYFVTHYSNRYGAEQCVVTLLTENNFTEKCSNSDGTYYMDAKRIGEPPEPDVQVAGSGTGFFVSSDGLVITNNHVINGANQISVTVPTGQTFTARVVSTSASTDLALLRIPYQNKNYLTFENPGAVEIGDDVFTLGFPVSGLLGKEVKYTDGSISSLSGLQGDATFFQISVPIQPGNSGGPLVNKKGNVVGIVTATAAVEAFYQATGSMPQNVNWAVKGAYASLLLPPGIKKAERSTDDPITNAKWSVVFIETK